MGRASNTSPKAKVAKKGNSSKSSSKSNGGGSGNLKAGEIRIIEALGKLLSCKIAEPKRSQLQTMSGNLKTPEGFKKTMGVLKKRGYIVYPSGDTVALGEAGLEYVGDVEPPTTEEYHQNIMDILPNKQAVEIFKALKDGQEHLKDEVIDALGLDRSKLSGFDKNLSKMKSLGYLNKTKETIQLTPLCFIDEA